ncbi:MAG: flagellin, partial [Opitutales bacterium]|nr:flagellin [Opitutales bacterium]
MPIVVNSNTTATVASFNLSRANDALRTSLARLSSGKRIVNPADDAGGLSVAN